MSLFTKNKEGWIDTKMEMAGSQERVLILYRKACRLLYHCMAKFDPVFTQCNHALSPSADNTEK